MGEIIPDKNKRLWYNIVSETLCNKDVFEELPRWYWDCFTQRFNDRIWCWKIIKNKSRIDWSRKKIGTKKEKERKKERRNEVGRKID